MKNWKRLVYFLPSALYCALIFFLSSGPINLHLKFFYWDKGWHWLEFSILGFLLAYGFFQVLQDRLPLSIYLTFMTGALIGLGDEIHQLFVPGRNCDWKDWLADLSGILAGLVIYLVLDRKLKSRKNHQSSVV
ncbi:MAG: VanZ family protein [Candidatus Aminicenantes bacterium]|nr:VanZ family protein [Candidatus Aminicenantes bacterium]